VILDCNGKEIEEFPSQLKAAEYLGVNRYIVNSRLASGKILDSKIGPVYIKDKEGISKKNKKTKKQNKTKTKIQCSCYYNKQILFK
jgi:uncharacterized protein YqkB